MGNEYRMSNREIMNVEVGRPTADFADFADFFAAENTEIWVYSVDTDRDYP